MEYTLTGQEELLSNLKKLGSKLGDGLEAAVKAGALLIQNMAKEKAPFKTGNLRRSIHMETTEKTGERAVVQVGTNVIYAAPQEFGTSTIPAHPYLRPALDKNKDKVPKEIGEALADIVRKGI